MEESDIVENMHKIPAYCEICHDVYLSNGIVIGGDTANLIISNSSVGTCPKDGGKLLVPDGTYSVKDEIMEFTSHFDKSEIYEILSVLEGRNFRTVRDIETELNKLGNDTSKIVEWIYRIFNVTNSLDLAIKFVISLMVMGAGIVVNEAFDKYTTSDDELRQKRILNNQEEDKKRDNIIINQNKEILEKLNKQEKRQQYKERKSTVVTKKKKGKMKK